MSVDLFKITITLWLLIFVNACGDEIPPAVTVPTAFYLEQPAPDFEFKPLINPGELSEKLSSYRGKVIYLDFWASWCTPCRKSMPLFNNLRKYLKQFGFEVIAVNLDNDPEKGREFIANYPVNYPVVRAVNKDISDLYMLNGLPTSYLIDRKGIVKHIHQGFSERDMKEIKSKIVKLLN